jgi:hypothetical protein
MMRQTLSWFTPPPVSKSLTTDTWLQLAQMALLKGSVNPRAGVQ